MRAQVGLGALRTAYQCYRPERLCSVHGNERYALKLLTARLYPTEVKMQRASHARLRDSARQQTEDYGRQKLQSIDGALIASLD